MDKQTVYKFQSYQREHDKNFHHDILVLGTKNRAQHLVLHFIKYFANLEGCTDNELIKRNLADFMICILSMANVFNIDLSKSRTDEKDTSLIKTIGSMAKACEALDHVESYPSRDVIINELGNAFFCILDLAEINQIDINRAILERWENIESTSYNSNVAASLKLSINRN